MKISFTTLGCPDWTLDEIIEAAVKSGYDGIDIRGYKREIHVYKLPEFSTDASATARKISDAGLEVSAFSSSARIFEADPAKLKVAMDDVAEYVKLCGLFGAEYIRVFGGSLGGASPDDAVATAVETLEEAAQMAAPVKLAVETHDDWIDSALLARVFRKVRKVREVRAENVGVLWDLHHPFRLKGETPQQTYDNIGRYVIYTHVKDSRPAADGKSHAYTLPGEGDVPNAEMIELLKAGGYDGWLTLEWEKMWNPDIADPEVALPAYADFLRQFK